MFCSLRCIYSLKEQGHVILYHYFWVKLFSSKDQNVRVLDVNDYIDNVSAESTTPRTRNVCTQFKFSFVPFIICFFSTYKTYPPCTVHVANCYLDILFPRSEQLRGQTIFANFFVNSKVLWSQFASSYWSKKGKKSLDQ